MDMQATYTHWLIVLCAVLAVMAFYARLRSHTAAQQAEARASEERLRQISDNIPGMIAYWDQQRVCRFANRAFCALLDLAPGQLLGMSLDDLFLPRFDAKWRPVADAPGRGPAEDVRRLRIAAALKGERQCFDHSDTGPDGSIRHWQCEYRPHLEDGKVLGFYAVYVDITQHMNAERRAAQQEARLATTSRMGEIGGWELERDAPGPWWSDVTYRIHDLPVGEMPPLGKALEHYPPEVRPMVTGAITAAFETGRPFDFVSPFITATGRRRWVRSIGEPQLVGGKYTRIVGAFQDVTDAREAEESLRKAKNAAEAANRAQSELLANLSHEIRTPLNGVIGMTHLLLESSLSPQQREYAEIVRSSGERLLGLVDHTLEFSKIDLEPADAPQVDRASPRSTRNCA
jgi:PAS domain S-box-containing protein